MSDIRDKKKILDIRLTSPEGDTPDSLLSAEHLRTAVNESSQKPAESENEFQDTPMSPLIPEAYDEVSYDVDAPEDDPPADKRRFVDKVISTLGGMVPKKGDPPLEIVRKCVFFVALITLIISLSYIINDVAIIPLKNDAMYNEITELYNPDNPIPPASDFPQANYPGGISDSFKALYARNQDVRGWMKYTDANKKWLNIDYPIMFSGDNEYYLHRDFQKAKNKNGALFFDERTKLESPVSTNRVLIVYGHNMASGQMLSPLNKFLSNLNYMRSAPLISMDTLYKRNQYVVFSVMLLSTRDEDGPYFNSLRTSFNSDEDYLDFIANIRARSIYDFNGVQVTESDELLILSTCTSKSYAKFDEGRCVVVARKVRDGETVAIRAKDIVKNSDVIMPYAWYINQKITPHKFYTDSGYILPGAKTTSSGKITTKPSLFYPTYPSSSNNTDSTTQSGSSTQGDTTASGTDDSSSAVDSTTADQEETTTTTTTDPEETTTTNATTTTTDPEETTTTTTTATTDPGETSEAE